ncbi:MAG: AAA domain-containing protein [Lachnospiraceae bacterium]|jgi:adenosylcobinamide kinase/adenosylcobinamide-phosphate guanylyltransferase|nr:AAA domain-containing protein [Lachnospiraceae bacterium]
MVVFVIGGSGSGKSEYAEQLAAELMEQETENKELSTSQKDARLVYIATMEPMDQESRQRILRHRAMREGRQFETWEQYTHLEELSFGYKDVLLLECLSNLMANEMFSATGRGDQAAEFIQKGIRHLAEHSRHLVIVGNNMFEDGMEYDRFTRKYLEEMAKIHQYLGRRADRVVEVVCGIPIEWRMR